MTETHYTHGTGGPALCGYKPIAGKGLNDVWEIDVWEIFGNGRQIKADHCFECRTELPKVLRTDYKPRTTPREGIEGEIAKFIGFYDHHRAGAPMTLEGGVLTTPGCEPGTQCCSKTFDLEGLVDALRELIE